MNRDELVKALRENAEWCDGEEWNIPIYMGDNQREAADMLENDQKHIGALMAEIRQYENLDALLSDELALRAEIDELQAENEWLKKQLDAAVDDLRRQERLCRSPVQQLEQRALAWNGGCGMTDREAIELISPETGLSKMAEIEYYHGFEGLDAVRKALSDAYTLSISALKEREERSKGCRYCSIGADMKNDEDMEMDLFNYAEGKYFSIYPNFCPVCGRKLKPAVPGEEV